MDEGQEGAGFVFGDGETDPVVTDGDETGEAGVGEIGDDGDAVEGFFCFRGEMVDKGDDFDAHGAGDGTGHFGVATAAIDQDSPGHFGLNWSGRRESNSLHSAWEADVLPVNYSRSGNSILAQGKGWRGRVFGEERVLENR